MTEPVRTNAPVSPLQWIAAGGLLVGALLPALAAVELFPFWDLDPTRNWVPTTGVTPAGMLALAVLSLGGAGLAFVAEARRGRPVSIGMIALATVGSLGVVAHAVFDRSLHEGVDGIEHAVKAAPWLAMVWGAVGLSHLCRDARVRTVVLALLAALAVPLVARGAAQVFVDHPQTVAEFERTKEAVLEANGWLPGSPAALAYERRLVQAEASGWFGLSNVYASFMGAIAAGLIAACVATVLRTKRLTVAVAVAGCVALCALAGLALSKSKGGIGAMGLALALCAGVAVLRWRTPRLCARISPWVGPAAIAIVLAAIGVRGLIGTELGEKSLLFRSFYAIGSVRIWGDYPLLGVGPDGFQDAYAAAKIPIATETVQSPHSVVFDWTATLGLAGLAWVVLLVWQSTRLVTPRVEAADGDDAEGLATRDAVRAIVLIVAAAGLGSAFVERELATPVYAVVRLVGLAGWIAGAIGMARFVRAGTVQWLAMGAGLALVAHAQIEVTPVWVNAAPLFGVWLGVCAVVPSKTETSTDSGTGTGTGTGAKPSLLLTWVPAGIAAALAVWIMATVWVPVWRWESNLKAAAMVVRPGAELRVMLDEAVAMRDRAGLERVAAEVSAMSGRGVPARAEVLDRVVESIRLRLLEAAAEPLEQAERVRPGHIPSRIERDRAYLTLAASTREADAKAGYLEAAHWLWSDSSEVRPRSIGLWDWRGVKSERLADMTAEIEGAEQFVEQRLDEAMDAWRETEARSPHAVRPAVRLMDLLNRRGQPEEARVWAAEAIRRDGLTGLDPISGLTPEERARAESLIAE